MKTLLRRLLLLNKPILFAIFIPFSWHAQINHVTNGSFENIINCNSPFIDYKAIGWSGVDSTKFTAPLYNIVCGNVPNTQVGYQMPQEGGGFIRLSLYYPQGPTYFTRSNLKNRLRQQLKVGATYCAKMYVNLQHNCPTAIDGFDIYFGGGEIDTIKYFARLPLTFLTPQVSNPSGNIVNDTASWTPVTGTFVATGGEKYMVIGNLRSDAITTTTPSVSNYTAQVSVSEYFFDEISCIELDTQFAGRDTSVWPGDSLFLGKTNDDDWLEAKFTWYKLLGSAPITTVTGFWVKPVSTESYVVKQEICGYTIWDTIVIGIKTDDVRVAERQADFLKVFPVPAKDYIELRTDVPQWYHGLTQFSIVNSLGQEIIKGVVDLSRGRFIINVSLLPDGVYTFTFFGSGKQKIVKRILISD
jgi:hypothetical protein